MNTPKATPAFQSRVKPSSMDSPLRNAVSIHEIQLSISRVRMRIISERGLKSWRINLQVPHRIVLWQTMRKPMTSSRICAGSLNPHGTERTKPSIPPLFSVTGGLAILSNLQKFLMELGKGYAFVARQQHIHTEKQDYYIDLVFYNYILKCFMLIDLKTEKITHDDVGQMDIYIRMYDEMKRSEGDNPTIGIVLCSDTDKDIARYSVMHGSEQLLASKYKLYLPTEEELQAEIETKKVMFYLQQKEENLEKYDF